MKNNFIPSTIDEVELLRIRANGDLDPIRKRSFGQFFTPAPISQYMASLFSNIEGNVRLLDPGCGVGSLSAAFFDETIRRNKAQSLYIKAYDIEDIVIPYIKETFNIFKVISQKENLQFSSEFVNDDFIISNAFNLSMDLFSNGVEKFTHAILNPPYKKIHSNSKYKKALKYAGIDSVNLYTGFVALTIMMLENNGEMVAIIPRSFTNGTYYQSFRELLLSTTAIDHIHIFESRDKAFQGDDVLQENVILHCIKGKENKNVAITSSLKADFHSFIEGEEFSVSTNDLKINEVEIDKIIKPSDKKKLIHIPTTINDFEISNRLSIFNNSLEELGLSVSTGPVVDFRQKEFLTNNLSEETAPLIYTANLNKNIEWPITSKKPSSIFINDQTKPYLWKNKGYFVVIKRFSSKEEKKRIVASIYDSTLDSELIGFDNKLNIIHNKKIGIDKETAFGLYIYLNSTLIDRYYRQFGGHTQINAGDLRALKYPTNDQLKKIGGRIEDLNLTQQQIDDILEEEMINMGKFNDTNPLLVQQKIQEALEILIKLGMPRAQQNERSALALLALSSLLPEGDWAEIEKPMLGVTPIMDWCRDNYKKEYAPNTRETFRRQTLHQFMDGGMVIYNPDEPDRPVNSPKACYQLTSEVFNLLQMYKTPSWNTELNKFLAERKTLSEKYALPREMTMIPLKISESEEIKLTPGNHSKLIHDIVEEFGPRFAPGAELIYVGDTGGKIDYFIEEKLQKLGVTVDNHGKMPDVILYSPDKNWLFLIEAVTSHGPMDSKRHRELEKLFANSQPSLIYVTAFPDKKVMASYMANISWESEVWVATSPTHMIHFNGDKFLGPYKK